MFAVGGGGVKWNIGLKWVNPFELLALKIAGTLTHFRQLFHFYTP